MGRFIKCIRELILKLDLFPATQFLRYQQEEEYKTLTGGLTSAAIIILFTIIFYNLGIETINKQIINSTITYQSKVQPQRLSFSLAENSTFMFAIGIDGLNLSDANIKYLNITLSQSVKDQRYTKQNITFIPLIQCTQKHFSYNSETLKYYNDFDLSQMLCPPFNRDFSIGGKLSSKAFESFSINVKQCNHTIDPICADDQKLAQFLAQHDFFTIITPIISTMINPGESDYKNVYIEDRNYYYFTSTIGLQLTAQIQQYKIDTDNSLMPWKNIESEQINTVPNLMQAKNAPVINGLYVEIKFCKSSISTTFTRSFNKLDSYFSYVGGLVGSILILFFILHYYSEKSYLVSIAFQLYNLSGSQSQRFNFLYFISTNIQRLFNFFGIKMKWQGSSMFLEAIQQIEKQLSINFLLKKINFLQDAIYSLLNQHQIQILHLKDKKSIQDAANQRKQNTLPYETLKPSKISDISLLGKPDQPLQQNYLSRDSFGPISALPQQLSIQSNEPQQQSRKQEKVSSIKNSLQKVIQQSLSGNAVSRRILQKVSKNINLKIQQMFRNQKSKVQEQNRLQKVQFNSVKSQVQEKKDISMGFQFQEMPNQ